MSQLDIAKETIAYLKFWLGIMIVSDISLIGWLLSNTESNSIIMTYSAVFSVGIITLSAFFVHKRIERLISTLAEL